MRWKPRVEELLLKKSADEKRRIEQQEVAERTQLPQATISRWMNTEGFLRYDATSAQKLSEYFGVHWSELVELVEEDKDDTDSSKETTRSAHAA